jgi:hypothetical protein
MGEPTETLKSVVLTMPCFAPYENLTELEILEAMIVIDVGLPDLHLRCRMGSRRRFES